MTDFESKVKGAQEQREYCVQYGESNFAFVSRLMEEEGIYYCFDYSGSTEKLILANDGSAHEDKGEVQFTKSNILQKVRADADTIYEWAEIGKVVSGKVSLWDYDFTLPNSNLLATKAATGVGSHSHNQIERYQSGAHYKTAEKGESFHANNVAEAHAANYARATGLCNNALIRAGMKFTFKHAERPSVNGNYLVVGSTHYIRFDDQTSGTEMDRLNRNVEQIRYPAQMALYEAEFEVQPGARRPGPRCPAF
jgi:type VI secretion system secreted protein VgrG